MARRFDNEDRSQTIALRALTFLLSEPSYLDRFLGETGFAPADIKANAQSAHVLEAALNVLVGDEPLLLTFAANSGLRPEDVVQAHDELSTSGGSTRSQTSQ